MTVEFTYYTSGHWKATCTTCGASDVFDSLAQAYTAARRHDRTHL